MALAAGVPRKIRISPTRTTLDAVWQTAKGKPIGSAALQDLETKLSQGVLDADEPQAWGAWSAWCLVELALACCSSAENIKSAEETGKRAVSESNSGES
jgi:hypothetical protein